MNLSKIDHFVYTAPTLAQGMDKIEALFGMRPVMGGQHPDFGTHNALLSLGGETYFEVIAADPSLKKPANGYMFQIDPNQSSRLARWALREEAIQEVAHSAAQQGLDLGSVFGGSRKRPDGSTLSWQLSDPSVIPFDGTIPFLLSWGHTIHPATQLPVVGSLSHFQIEHPFPEKVRAALEILGVELDVTKAEQARLIANIIRLDGKLVQLS